MARSRWWAVLAVPIALSSTGCEREPTPAPESPARQAPPATGWEVVTLDRHDLGDGWTARALPDPAAGVIDGLCGIPEVLEHFPPREVVRYEGDAVVTHAVVETEDAGGLAALLVTELELCEQEDERVTDAEEVDLAVDAPPTDAFRIEAFVEDLHVRADAVWAITAVDATSVSIVGASVTELFDDPDDPRQLVAASMEHVYRQRRQAAG